MMYRNYAETHSTSANPVLMPKANRPHQEHGQPVRQEHHTTTEQNFEERGKHFYMDYGFI